MPQKRAAIFGHCTSRRFDNDNTTASNSQILYEMCELEAFRGYCTYIAC